jgi:serine/threonine-protein kinase
MIENISKRYKIISELDKGGMANIYLANDSYGGNLVAIKVLKNQKNNAVDGRRFKSEVKLTTRVDSKYVVKIIDYVLNDDIQYIVMEYIEGTVLKKKIEQRINFNSNETVNITKDILLGLQKVHEAGIVHRDIKSLNIMIANSGEAKIIDFGISLSSDSEHLTKTNNVIGSAHYLAPEIINGSKATNVSDIYALGILMFEMLTGRYPYNSKDYLVVANKHKNKPLPLITKYNNNVRQSVINVIKKATAKNISDRYKSAQEMYDDVSTALSDKRLHEKPLILPSERKKTSLANYFTNQ